MSPTTFLRCGALLLPFLAATAFGDDTGPAKQEPNDAFHASGLKIQAHLDEVYGKGFWTYLFDDGVMPRPYLVAREFKSNIDLDIVDKQYADLFGCLYTQFYAEYGERFGLKPITEPVVVLIYDSKDAYKKVRLAKPSLHLANEEFIGGYYEPGRGIMTQWESEDLWHVVFHEGTHQLIDYATRDFHVPQSNQYAWFQEGVADYMGGHDCKTTVENGKLVRHFTLGQFIPDRFTSVQRAVMDDSLLTVKDLVNANYNDLHEKQSDQEGNSENQQYTGTVYAEGWALVMFLHRNKDDKKKFDEYFQAELHGEGGQKKFGEIFSFDTQADWDAFDDEFRAWVQSDLRNMRPIKKVK